MKQAAKEKKIQAEKNTARVITRYLRISPRKVRGVLDQIRLKPVSKAFEILALLNMKGARMAEKALKSAVANAKVLKLDETRLFVSDARADQGPVFKRFRPRSMGRADRILKRMTHLSLKVTEGARSFEKKAGEAAAVKAEETKAGTKTDKKKPASPVKGKKKASAAK